MSDLEELHAALRDAFPHFQDDALITPEVIRSIGREYIDMVMTWAPVPKQIEFVDMIGHPGKLTFEDDVWYFDGIVTA